MSTFKAHVLIHDMESNEYHGTANTFSSSQMKDALDDMELFYKKHITKEIERDSADHLDVGTYFHTGVLEAHKLKKECAIYPKPVRRGSDWEAFKKKHPGKMLVTKKQAEQAERLIRAVQNSPVAMGYIKRGKPEVSAFLEISIYQGEIYAPVSKMILTKEGWEKHDMSGSTWNAVKRSGVNIVIKSRADCLGDDFILDLKSTTGNAKSRKEMSDKISYYTYDLSAAFYLDIFSAVTKRPYTKFIWTFASKDFDNSRSYLASRENILIGRAKYRKALLGIAEGLSSQWVFDDLLDILEPKPHELFHIQPTDIDLV